LQNEYSLWTRDCEGEILALCRELGIALVAYSPLGRGFLTGAIRSTDTLAPDDVRRRQPRFLDENFAHNLVLLEALESVARNAGAAPAQVALAWLLAQGDDIVPIPGTKRRTYLETNAAAAGLQLGPADLALLSRAFAPGTAKGDRYPAHQMKLLGH
jgi:aryl-alcohol dehydrogenase-like predicted oxidoreductase